MPKPVPPLLDKGKSLFIHVTPAISKWAHATSSFTNLFKSWAAVILPAPLVPVIFFTSAMSQSNNASYSFPKGNSQIFSSVFSPDLINLCDKSLELEKRPA